MAILGFSSSPIKGGNVDRMVQALLDKVTLGITIYLRFCGPHH